MTALHWHRLRGHSRAVDRPIVCATCRRPYAGRPPPFGCCVCGGYFFEVQPADVAQPALPLGRVHG